jgi:glucosaminylphosphatidylinositol acyltransferase
LESLITKYFFGKHPDAYRTVTVLLNNYGELISDKCDRNDIKMESLKEEKEAFVTGHAGTSPLELLLVCISAPIGVWMYQSILPSSWNGKITLEALSIVAMTICQTNFLYPWGIGYLFLQLILPSIWSKISKRKRTFPLCCASIPPTIEGTYIPTLAFLSCYRASVFYLTFVAILAVDFHVFPRRFAKTEIHGYGLMDLGAGSFVVAAGLVSRRARTRPIMSSHASSTANIWNSRKFIFHRFLPLMALGTIRLLTLKGLEYQEHVSEYGVHWNFFFTLAILMPIANLIPNRWEIPLVLMTIYQFILSKSDLQDFIESYPRKCLKIDSTVCDLVVANREGILGILGYLSIFLLSELLGNYCIWNANHQRLYRLGIASTVLWVIHQGLVLFGIRSSRRSTNATFCVWTLAHNTTLLFLLDLSCFKNKTPPILNAMNRGGLFIFVVANLLTGLVNLSINTLLISDQSAILIIFLYLCTLGILSLMFDYFMSKILRKKLE